MLAKKIKWNYDKNIHLIWNEEETEGNSNKQKEDQLKQITRWEI